MSMVSNRFTQSCNKLITIPRRNDINIRTTTKYTPHLQYCTAYGAYISYIFLVRSTLVSSSQLRLLSEAPNPEKNTQRNTTTTTNGRVNKPSLTKPG